MRVPLLAAVMVSVGVAAASAQTSGHSTSAVTPGGVEASAAAMAPELAGRWRSAPDRLRLTSAFDESVWGKGASSERVVELVLDRSGEGTLTITKRVVDAKGRTVPASTSIENVKLAVGGSKRGTATRIEHEVKVLAAERRYPDDPDYRWTLDGVKVKLVTFEDGDGATMEVWFETPEPRGSFWETLRREGRGPSSRQAAR
jgi:hypothetical protein